ncbi:TrmH family RNA methyltransferase [Sphingobacteriales bacterium UPWRP_1]|nr:RNA methyltransferase [Sphingobacteriales bacterium TSM_CSM]PSJ73676.1 TrmH family RNA methyltransferase [Sphingobacteriales bacterium UPWRP_1]
MEKTPNSGLNRLSAEDYRQVRKLPFVVVLDNVRSANNVGSVFRTADAFLLEAVYLCGITATPPNKDIHKTALGAADWVHWHYAPQTTQAIMQLKAQGYRIAAVEQAKESIPLNRFTIVPEQKYALIFGHEVTGVSEEVMNLSDVCIEIPQFGSKHSLNIAVSVGVVLWELVRQTTAIKTATG